MSMKMNILRKMQYQGTFIYVAQFLTTFQYIFAWNNEVYQQHFNFRPSIKNYILWKLGRRDFPYTTEQLERAEQIALSGAVDSVDKLISAGTTTRQSKRAVERKIDRFNEKLEAKSKEDCAWWVLNTDSGNHYQCLTHGNIVKMVDGEKPTHEKLSPVVSDVTQQ